MPSEPDEGMLALFTITSFPIPDSVLRNIYENANILFSLFADRVLKKARQGWVDHVRKELSSRGGTLFKYISKQDKHFLNVDIASKGGISRDPDRFLQDQVCTWTKFWSPGIKEVEEAEHENLHILLTGLRDHALLEPVDPPLTPIVFGNALKGYRKDTKGSDNWKSSELNSLPDYSKSEIADALNLAQVNIAQLHQHLICLNSCLGKPNKDIRTVCKTPMLYRMMCRTNQSIKDWETQHTQHYDSTQVGSSASMSALFRNLCAEVAMWTGKHSAGVFNDYHKFFDTIDIPTLVSNAVQSSFSIHELAISLQQHLAPRVIQVSGFCSTPTKVYKSIYQDVNMHSHLLEHSCYS